ncbi:hypothetical protein ACOMHN_061831 [Nucella lapillus]
MEEIESFVRKLCTEGDLSILTKKLIRTQYQAHYKKATVTREEKDKINEVLETVIQELADQSKDPPASTDENSSSLDQGKENLRTDYACVARTEPTPVGLPHKAGYRSTWGDLGIAGFTHNHLIQVSMNENASSGKNPPPPRFRSRSAGNNEVPPQHRSSPRKRTSSDSVSRTRDSLSCDRERGGGVMGRRGEESVELANNAGEVRTPVKTKRAPAGRNGDSYSNCSSDEVLLLSPGSDSSSRKSKPRSPPKWRKARMERMKALGKSDISGSGGKNGGKPSTKQRQVNKSRRMYSVQSVLSAILESDIPVQNEDELSHALEKQTSLSPPDKASRRPPPSRHSQPVRESGGSKLKGSLNKDRHSRNSPEDHNVVLARRQGLSQRNRTKTRPVYIESEDSQDGLSVRENLSHQRSVSKEAENRVNGSGSVPKSSSKNLLISGFSTDRFFATRVKPAPQSKAKRQLRVESDSELSCSSLPSPGGKGKKGRLKSSQPTPGQNSLRSDDSDSVLSERLQESPGKVKAKKSSANDSFSHNGDNTAERMTFPARGNFKQTEMKPKAKRTLKNKGKKGTSSSDDSDTDDLPLSLVQQKGKKTDPGEEFMDGTDSEASGKSSQKRKNDKHKEDGQSVKKKMRKEGVVNVRNRTESLSSFSPPVSPFVKKALKRDPKTGLSLSDTGAIKGLSPKEKLTSEDNLDDSSCNEADKSTSLGPKSGNVRAIKKDVYSLSESSDDKRVPGELLLLDERKVHKKRNNSGNRICVEWSVYSLSESTEEGSGKPLDQLPFIMKKKINKGKEKNVAKDELSDECVSENCEGELSFQNQRKNTSVCEDETPEENRVCDEPWCSVEYRGEPLMFPIIQLQDIQQGAPTSSENSPSQKVSCKKERNIFEMLEFSAMTEDDTRPPKVRISLSEWNQEHNQHYISAVIKDQTTGKPRPASLDESRTVLKKQRTVKRITPHLRTTLKLRKQVSPNVSSKVEEWAVVSQDERDVNGDDDDEKLRDGSSGVDSLPPKRHWSKFKARKRKAAAMMVSSDDDDDDDNKPLMESARDLRDSTSVSDKDLRDNASVSDKDLEEDTPVKAKARKRKAAAMVVSSDEEEDDDDDDDDKPLMESVQNSQDNVSELDKDFEDDTPVKAKDFEDDTPVKAKKPKGKKLKVQLDSSGEDDLPLKAKSDSDSATDVEHESETENGNNVSETDDDGDLPLNVKKSKKRKKKQPVESDDNNDDDDDDDEPLKPRCNTGEGEECGDNSEGIQLSEEDLTPVKIKKSKKRRKKKPVESDDNNDDDDDDDEPLKPRCNTGEGEEYGDNSEGIQPSEEDLAPVKIKTSLKAPKLIFVSSDDGLSPMKVRLKPSSREAESDLDTSSLSSSSNNDETRPEPKKSQGPRIKFTMKKVQPSKKAQSKKAREKKGKAAAAEVSEKEEAPHLKRLRLICRKVGIFVRNDVHFAGCTSDRQKIERLKEALRNAGMKGQPSLSKVDSVNLKREAAALDTTNIIHTSGRPKRKQKDIFEPASPKKSLSPIKKQFSRIQDLIDDGSESD